MVATSVTDPSSSTTVQFEVSAVAPNVLVEITPLNPPIVIPPEGGNLDFDVYVENASGAAQDFDAWLASEYEGGPPETLVLRSFTNYLAGWTINRPAMFYPIPGGWAAGSYEFFGRVGDEPDEVWNESGFTFTKEGVPDGSYFRPWPVAGAPNPFDEIIKNDRIIPDEFANINSYPNPFNPVSTLSFTLPQESFVRLSIHDLQGRLVATLIKGNRNAGTHEITFDASALTSGVYIARLEAGSYSVTQKMVLLK
jgi:hypothetical protein